MSTAHSTLPSDEWHTYITSLHRRRTCQATYTISKDVHHSLTSLIGTARREVGSAPPPPRQPVSLLLSRHGRTDVMAMKDALGGWSGGGPMHAQCSTPARWVATTQCQPTNARQPPWLFPNDADHRAGRPPPPRYTPRYTGLIARHRCLDRRP